VSSFARRGEGARARWQGPGSGLDPGFRLRPGDLVFMNGVQHVGLYAGGNRVIHAPRSGDVVKVSRLTGWYASAYVGARRIVRPR
jgi:cell wall-associated NlpC family hydrolase